MILYFPIGFFCVVIYFGRVLNRTGLLEARSSAWAKWFRAHGLEFILRCVGLFVFWLPYLLFSAVRMMWQGERYGMAE